MFDAIRHVRNAVKAIRGSREHFSGSMNNQARERIAQIQARTGHSLNGLLVHALSLYDTCTAGLAAKDGRTLAIIDKDENVICTIVVK